MEADKDKDRLASKYGLTPQHYKLVRNWTTTDKAQYQIVGKSYLIRLKMGNRYSNYKLSWLKN